MAKIFFSYRRMDSRDETLELWRVFAKKFWLFNRPFDSYLPRKRLFVDIETMDYVEGDFRKQIQRFIVLCDTVLVIIGPDWLTELQRRFAKGEADWVRVEVELSLVQDKRIIPVLINGASMPDRAKLPEDMRRLTNNHAATIRVGYEKRDMQSLASRLNPARDYQFIQFLIVLFVIFLGFLGLWQGVFANPQPTPTPIGIVVVADDPTETLTIAPTQPPTIKSLEFSLYRDETSLTIYVLEGETGSLVNVTFEVSANNQVRGYALDDPILLSFGGYDFSQVQGPICFRLEKTNGTIPPPIECSILDASQRLTQHLATANIFWYDEPAKTGLLINVMRGSDELGRCPGTEPKCVIKNLSG